MDTMDYTAVGGRVQTVCGPRVLRWCVRGCHSATDPKTRDRSGGGGFATGKIRTMSRKGQDRLGATGTIWGRGLKMEDRADLCGPGGGPGSQEAKKREKGGGGGGTLEKRDTTVGRIG